MFSTLAVLYSICSLTLLSTHHAPNLFCTKSAYTSILCRQAREMLWYFPACCNLVLGSRSRLIKKNMEIKLFVLLEMDFFFSRSTTRCTRHGISIISSLLFFLADFQLQIKLNRLTVSDPTSLVNIVFNYLFNNIFYVMISLQTKLKSS